MGAALVRKGTVIRAAALKKRIIEREDGYKEPKISKE
jgi:hypothetical protein